MSRCESTSLNYSLHEEMTLTPVDFLLRRTSHLLFMSETVASLKQPVVDAMAAFYNWSEADKQEHLATLETTIAETELQYLKQDD